MWKLLLCIAPLLSFTKTQLCYPKLNVITEGPGKNFTDFLTNVIDPIVNNFDLPPNPATATATQFMNSSELIMYYGYNAEEHKVNSNGYCLKMFRIPGTGPPVLLVHGLSLSSDDWLSQGSTSLPIFLASLGYDVWLGNCRGSTYSRKHCLLSPANPEFWDFSWHEIGTDDIAAFIDYIICITGIPRITYVGHSQGTTSMYVLLSEKPEYNEKLLGVVSLASVSYISNTKSPTFLFLARSRPEIEAAARALNLYEWLPHRPPTSTITTICGSTGLLATICLTFSYTISGVDYFQIDFTKIKDELTHYPGGFSLKQLMHYLQNVNSGLFQKYDYGAVENLVVYGTSVAPSYDVERITTNMTIVTCDNDFLANENDVNRFIARLPTPPEVFKVAFADWNHIDYLWGRDANSLVYVTVEQQIRKYTS